MFPIENGLKQGDALLLMLFKFPLKYGIRRVRVIQGGLELNGMNQHLVCADDGNILGGSVQTVQKNTGTLAIVRKEDDETKCMVMCQDQNAG
jgi:hypothetical protein